MVGGDQRGHGAFVRHVRLHAGGVDARPAELVDDVTEAFDVAVGERQRRPLGAETPGGGGADSRRRSRDDGDPPEEAADARYSGLVHASSACSRAVIPSAVNP